MSIKAIKNISQVRGGSQARIMLADDGKKYVVKFQGNPQATRVLANEYLGLPTGTDDRAERAGAGHYPRGRRDDP